MGVARAALVFAACASKSRIVEDGRAMTPAHEPAIAAPATPYEPAKAAPAVPYRTETQFASGDVQVRVEWRDVPTAALASATRTPCGTAAAPAVSPTTTWGIPDAIVMVDADRGKPLADPEARIVSDGCGVSPRAAVAGSTLVVASVGDRPMRLSLARAQFTGRLLAGAAAAPPRAIQLPVIGHDVEIALSPGALYTLAVGAETATVVAAATPYYAVTEANGQVVLRNIPIGKHAVAALIPARAGQAARMAAGTVTVVANALAEVTVDMAHPP